MRKFALIVLGLVYIPLLILLPNVISFNQTLGDQNFVKQTLAEAGVYAALSNYITEEAVKNGDISGNPVLLDALKRTVSPEQVQQLLDPVINNVYTGLSTPGSNPTISVPIETLQKTFMDNVETAVRERLATLPPCSRTVPLRTDDPFNINCLPPGTDIEAFISKAKQDLQRETEQALPSDDSLSLTTDQSATNSAAPDTKKVNEQLDMAGKLYRFTKASEPFLIGLAAAITIGLVLLSRPWVRGLKRVGWLLLIASAILLVSALVLGVLIPMIVPSAAPEQVSGLSTAGEQSIKILSAKVFTVQRTFCIVYASVGLLAIIFYMFLRKRFTPEPVKAPKEDIESSNLLANQDEEKSDKIDIKE